MLRLASYDIVFQEVPGEVSLALTLSGCPNRCKGCHSPELWQSVGKDLSETLLDRLIQQYGSAITCICFMGGDAFPQQVERLAAFVRTKQLKTCWYSGKPVLPSPCFLDTFDFVKLGPYVEQLGGLNKASTNQRFYRIENKQMLDITQQFCS